MISSPQDGILLNIPNKDEHHFADEHDIQWVKCIVYDEEDKVFYIMCNKFNEKLGFFVLKIHETDY